MQKPLFNVNEHVNLDGVSYKVKSSTNYGNGRITYQLYNYKAEVNEAQLTKWVEPVPEVVPEVKETKKRKGGRKYERLDE